jgi:hypothetical protein
MHAMSESGYASLGPSLLARKGGAKPAMRPQLPVLGTPEDTAKVAEAQLEDLGWNDMGDDEASGSPVVVSIDPDTPFNAAAAAASPIVRRQQRRLEERLLADAVMTGPDEADFASADDSEGDWAEDETTFAPLHSDEPPLVSPRAAAARTGMAAIPANRPVASQASRRAAFTLRLDPERHLKLRLAATMRGISAQALVTGALDALLAEFEELDTIAAHLQRH